MNELPPGAMEEIMDLIYGGQKIMACKRYMEMCGASLLEAKQFVEELTDKLRKESPGDFKATSKSGCAGLLITMAIAAISTAAALLLLTVG